MRDVIGCWSINLNKSSFWEFSLKISLKIPTVFTTFNNLPSQTEDLYKYYTFHFFGRPSTFLTFVLMKFYKFIVPSIISNKQKHLNTIILVLILESFKK